MKKFLFWAVIFMLVSTTVFAQGFRDPFQEPDQNSVMGGLGMTWIDGQPYTTVTLAPEFAFGKIGIGFYLQLLMDNNNQFKLRKTEYQGGAGVLRAINYVRYGRKYDPFYARVGMLEMATLGNGFLMWNYNNASNYDKRKIGLALDIDFGRFGFESVTSNLGRLELIGGTLYFRPFRFMNDNVPILRNFRIYGTYIYDADVPSWETNGETDDLSAVGIGADLQYLNTPLLKSAIYYDYGKFVDFGHGQAVGINFVVPEFIGLFGLAANFEKRFIGDQFIPNYFGPLYELSRELNPFDYPDQSRILDLKYAKKTEGYFGQLVGHVIHKVRLIGSYQRLNGIKRSGILHLEAQAPDLVPRFVFRGYYDKTGIETFKDFRTLDIRSIATAEVGYRLNRFLVVSTLYRWYWVKEEDANGNVKFKPVERIEPRISFDVKF
ncbi:MAG: hypothetical protein P8184_15050 [Calditrichia bacterium]